MLKTFSVTWGYSSLEFGPTSFGSQSPEYSAPSLHSMVFPSFWSIWQLQIALLKALVHQYIVVTIFLWSSWSSTDSPKWTRRSPGSVTYSMTCDWSNDSVNIRIWLTLVCNSLRLCIRKINEWNMLDLGCCCGDHICVQEGSSSNIIILSCSLVPPLIVNNYWYLCKATVQFSPSFEET